MSNYLLTNLSFSAGVQSSAILWMVLRGDIECPDNFVVTWADPGMENSKTYEYVEMMRQEIANSSLDIEFIKAEGDNLYEDIVTLADTDKKRFDNPPYWTKGEDGSKGRLLQSCTRYYKIEPIRRVIRQVLWERHGISMTSRRIGVNIVNTWIGFSFDELSRIKPSERKYIEMSYPLIDLKMKKGDCLEYYYKNDLPVPPRSVCNACFANGLGHYRRMFRESPDDWQQAVKVDRAVRDLSQVGVDRPVYVSTTLISLEELAKADFDPVEAGLEDAELEDYSCDSGYCFV